jgi:hypothetical protein
MNTSLEVNTLNLHFFSTRELQLIAIEHISRLLDRENPGNAQLAKACLDEIVIRESVAWESGHVVPTYMMEVE